jgi:anti-sigma factor RsiW
MNCEEIQAQLSDYLDRSLGAEPTALVEEHLAACPPCREEIELLGESIRQVAALPLVEPPLGFTQRVMAHVREIETQPSFWHRLYLLAVRQKLPVQATALVTLGILGVYLLQKEETYKQSTPIQAHQVTDAVEQDDAPTLQDIPAPPTTTTSKAIASAKATAGQSAKEAAASRASQSQSAARSERSQSSGSPAAKSTDGAARAPDPSDRAAPMISGTAVANHVSSQAGGGSVALSFPFESDAAFRSGPSFIVPFADYELVVRRHGRPPAESRSEAAAALRKAEMNQPAAERPSIPRPIDRLMAAIPDHARPQTIWVTVPKNQYEQFKKELDALGTIESEIRVPLLRDQTAAQIDGQIRVRLTAVPEADSSTPNPPAGR